MAKPLSAEEVQILKEAFDEYDTDKGGNITVEEFGRVMKESGQNPSEEELAQIIREVDLDGDGTIYFDEFIAMMTGRSRHPAPEPAAEPVPQIQVDSEAEYKSAWKEFDSSLQGSITTSQLRQVVANIGMTVTDVEIEEIMNTVDGDDRISYREFLEFAKRKEVDDIVGDYGA